MGQTPAAHIVWFRDDLRIADNPALSAAWASGEPVIGLYILDPKASRRPLGAAGRWWLHGSLMALKYNLAKLGVPLVLRRGATLSVLGELVQKSGAKIVFFNRSVDQTTKMLEGDAQHIFKFKSVQLRSFDANLLFAPGEIVSKTNEPYRVFTPFWRAAIAKGPPQAPIDAPQGVRTPPPEVTSDDVDDWKLRPTKPNWAKAFGDHFTPGEDGAIARLKSFVSEGLHGYCDRRDRPDQPSTSLLSPHLRFGEISPHRIWQAVNEAALDGNASQRDVVKFQSELGWREFSHHLLFHFPDLHQRSFQPRFDRFPWREDASALRAWQRGETGYPIVDAGMRQLWQTGFMHNRVRMITASFLIKHLLIDWREGERWFWDCLLDACPANNPAGWQWVAGSGADAAPYYRIFNPVLQGERFDPDGVYVRRFVPELARLPSSLIHRPWEAGGLLLNEAGIRLGTTYPYPLIDLNQGRNRALAALACIQDDGCVV